MKEFLLYFLFKNTKALKPGLLQALVYLHTFTLDQKQSVEQRFPHSPSVKPLLGRCDGRAHSSQSNLKSCMISLRSSLILIILEWTQESLSVTHIHESCRQLHHKTGKQKQIFAAADCSSHAEAVLTSAWLPGSALDGLPPQGDPGPAAWPAAAWLSVGKKARLIRIYANHLSARGGDETEGRL